MVIPKTRGELRDKLKDGESCLVASHVSDMTEILLRGWQDCTEFTTRPAPGRPGWTLFEPTVKQNTD